MQRQLQTFSVSRQGVNRATENAFSVMFGEVGTGGTEVERVKGIEPSSQPWEGHILPLNHTRYQSTSSVLTVLRF